MTYFHFSLFQYLSVYLFNLIACSIQMLCFFVCNVLYNETWVLDAHKIWLRIRQGSQILVSLKCTIILPMCFVLCCYDWLFIYYFVYSLLLYYFKYLITLFFHVFFIHCIISEFHFLFFIILRLFIYLFIYLFYLFTFLKSVFTCLKYLKCVFPFFKTFFFW